MTNKQTGSYYTPSYLADFISKRVVTHLGKRNRLSVIEPSVGDGNFLRSLMKNDKSFQLTALDINREELSKAKSIWNKENSNFLHQDFLEFQTRKQFSAVIGNPPYIKRHHLSEKQLDICQSIHQDVGLSNRSIKNIWTSFLLKSTTLLNKIGVLAFVLPSDLLQVKYAEEIRTYLVNHFQKLEIFTFDDLMFDCKGQDTIVLFAYKQSKEKGLFFSHITNKSQLEDDTFELNKNEALVKANLKWSHHILSSEEINFLFSLKNKFQTVDDYCDSKPGIVTAANNYFIVNETTEKYYSLEKYTKPIVQKGILVNGSVVFEQADYENLLDEDIPSRLLRFTNNDSGKLSEKVQSYLKIGTDQEIHNRYKCKIRENWYVIPNVATEPEGFFFKRSHLYPKLLKNKAKVYVTDSAYKIEMQEDYSLESFIFSFYNSLTLIFAELEGRYYGGGVLELTPKEFKKLPLPYKQISSQRFDTFHKRFESKKNIKEILLKYSTELLDISKTELKELEMIRKKLINKRLRRFKS